MIVRFKKGSLETWVYDYPENIKDAEAKGFKRAQAGEKPKKEKEPPKETGATIEPKRRHVLNS